MNNPLNGILRVARLQRDNFCQILDFENSARPPPPTLGRFEFKDVRPLTATDVNIGTNTGTFLNLTFGIFQVTSVTGRFKVI